MNEPNQHPLDTTTQSPLPNQPLPATILKGNVSFSDDPQNWNKVNPVTHDQTPSSPTNEHRDRQENRPTTSTATNNTNTSSATNTPSISNTTTGTESAESPKQLSRRITGPGGRLLPEEGEEPESLRWTSRLSSYLRAIYDQFSPSLTLENKGSIARDHLANERTYLAWLRTSLSMITVGVAITQLFRLQSGSGTSTNEHIKVSELGRPLGGSFIALGILFLWVGTSRYFHSQTVLSYGQFPASRGSVILATVTVLAVLLACFIVVILQGRTS